MKCVQTKEYVEFIQDAFYLRLLPVEERLFRCVFSQEPILDSDSLLIDKTSFRPVSFSVEETEKGFQVRTSEVQAEVLKKDGRVIWTDLSDGSCLLEEGKRNWRK